MNEVFVLATSYHLYQFTDFMPNVVIREKVGLSLVVLNCLNVLLNLSVVSCTTLAITARKFKLSYLSWR